MMTHLTKILKLWRLDKPSTATNNWRNENKEKYPIRYFIQEIIPQKLRRWYNTFIYNPISNTYWALKYRVIPIHRYHLIDTGLSPKYYEIETRMLYGCFNLFKEFYEYQVQYGHINWQDKEHINTWNEMTSLYNWWANYDGIKSSARDRIRNNLDEQENQMLIRLIKIRCELWD